MKAWWRLRHAVVEAAPLLVPGVYTLDGDTATLLPEGGRGLGLFKVRVASAPRAGSLKHDKLIRRSDCLILLAANRGHVTRLYREPEKVERLVANSRWLRPAFPCPLAEPVEAGLAGYQAVREAFVSGKILRDADPDRWQPVFREFLHCCASHARRWEGRVDPSPWFAELETWKLPQLVGLALKRHREQLAEVLTEAPRLRSHGDAHNGNLMVTETGNLGIIDVERVEEQPFFFDAVSIPRGSDPVNRTLRRDYLAGVFDHELAAIWQAAGQTFRPEFRAAYLLAVAVAHAFRPQFATGPSSRRRDKLIKAAEKFAADIL